MDGELPSPWKEKMENHLTGCSGCSEKLENFRRLQGMFMKSAPQDPAAGDSSGIEASKERVWRKLESRRRFRSSYGLLRRRLSIPLPAAAAAAAVVIVFAAALFIRGGISGKQPDYSARAGIILAAEEEMPGFIPAAADMNGVLQYLDSDGSDIIILRLPESKNFFRAGEPVIMTADYTRSNQ